MRTFNKNGADGLARKPPDARNPSVRLFKNEILQMTSRRNQPYLRIMFYLLYYTLLTTILKSFRGSNPRRATQAKTKRGLTKLKTRYDQAL